VVVHVVERCIVCSGLFLTNVHTANCHQLTRVQTACWHPIMWYNTLYSHLSTSPTSRRLAGNASKWKSFASFNLFMQYCTVPKLLAQCEAAVELPRQNPTAWLILPMSCNPASNHSWRMFPVQCKPKSPIESESPHN
jgi:hypothetical protein